MKIYCDHYGSDHWEYHFTHRQRNCELHLQGQEIVHVIALATFTCSVLVIFIANSSLLPSRANFHHSLQSRLQAGFPG